MIDLSKLLPLLTKLTEISYLKPSAFPDNLETPLASTSFSYTPETLLVCNWFGIGGMKSKQMQTLLQQLNQPTTDYENALPYILKLLDSELQVWDELLLNYTTIEAGQKLCRLENHLYRTYNGQTISKLQDRAAFYAEFMHIIKQTNLVDVELALAPIQESNTLLALAKFTDPIILEKNKGHFILIYGAETHKLALEYQQKTTQRCTNEEIVQLTQRLQALLRKFNINPLSTSPQFIIGSVTEAMRNLEAIKQQIIQLFKQKSVLDDSDLRLSQQSSPIQQIALPTLLPELAFAANQIISTLTKSRTKQSINELGKLKKAILDKASDDPKLIHELNQLELSQITGCLEYQRALFFKNPWGTASIRKFKALCAEAEIQQKLMK